MDIIKHRINRISEIEKNFGGEIDVRDFNGEIVLSHDYPNQDSEKLYDFIKCFPKEQLLAINIKSCGIETDIHNIVKDLHKNYFLFDFSVPYLLNSINLKIPCAFRLSEHEKEFFNGPKWIWLDSFYSLWYDEKLLQLIKDKGYKVALVSPELHKRTELSEFKKIDELINKKLIDAICTDFLERWHD